MALVVETGAGLANAEAYISVADALTYFTNRGQAAAWAAVTNQEAALRLAADYMAQRYRLRWYGQRSTATQALDWPRQNVPRWDAPSGYSSGVPEYVLPTVLPVEVARANAELALRSFSGALMADEGQRAIEKTVGPITVKYDESSPASKQYVAVDALLAPYLSGTGIGGGAIPLGRV